MKPPALTRPSRNGSPPKRQTAKPEVEDRLPPHAPDAERGLLGACLESADARAECLPRLERFGPKAFFVLSHRMVFEAITALHQKGAPVDVVTVAERLRAEGKLEAAGGDIGLNELIDSCPSPASAGYYCEILEEKADDRAGLQIADAIIEGVYSDTDKRQFKDELAARLEQFLADRPGSSLAKRPEAIGLFEAKRLAEDAPEMLFQNRVMKRGESWLLNAPTGCGKSVLAVEASMLWALGREYLGFYPTRPLRSLLFVAEDDQDEMAWFRDGITRRHEFTPAECAEIGDRVHFVPVMDLMGASFIARDVLPNAERFAPDILHLNPALAYIGAEANDQRQVGLFLRGQWQPVLDRIGAGSLVYHHTPKPPANRKDDPQRFTADFSYSGLGSVEWANWARGILSLLPTATPGFFKLVCPKRGQRLGWRDPEGKATCVRFIAHTDDPETLGWRDADPDEVPKSAGRPKSANPDAVLGLLAKGGLETVAWQKKAAGELGVGRSAFYEVRAGLEAAGRIYQTPTEGWKIAQRSGKSGKSGKGVSEPSPESPLPTGGADRGLPGPRTGGGPRTDFPEGGQA